MVAEGAPHDPVGRQARRERREQLPVALPVEEHVREDDPVKARGGPRGRPLAAPQVRQERRGVLPPADGAGARAEEGGVGPADVRRGVGRPGTASEPTSGAHQVKPSTATTPAGIVPSRRRAFSLRASTSAWSDALS